MKKILTICALFLSFQLLAQQLLVSGPMLGYVEHREALIWLEVAPSVKTVAIRFQEKGKPQTARTVAYEGTLGKRYNPIKIELDDLNMNTEYVYDVLINEKKTALPFATTLKTKKIWEWREKAPDFSFLVGSCFYLNDPPYDRPGKPYGQNPKILETMGDVPSDFMLWGGDNLYFREADYSSESGIDYRYSFNFQTPEMQKLRATRANYAIWDDHDYGSNDSDKSYELKDYALETFKKYWGNKSFGEPDNKGVYTKFRWSDCDFFMLDDRYYRSADDMPDTINGKSNPDKIFFGTKQMEWLKNSLISSNATFKFILSGGQMLNPMAKDKECFLGYSYEWQELMDFIVNNKIKGLVFLTGDRHFSELIKFQPEGFYPLYEFTCSAVTSGVAIPNKAEQANPMRVAGTMLLENNFGKISISGEKDKRQLRIETLDINGMQKWQYIINENDLKIKQ